MLYKLILAALSFELSSIALLFSNSTGLGLIGAYLLLHGLGSIVISAAIALLVPVRYRQPRRWLLAYLFSFNFFIPLAGFFCSVAGIVLDVLLPRPSKQNAFDTVQAPRFTTHRNHEGTGFRGGQVRAQLSDSTASVDQRLKALIAVQDTPSRTTGSLLRDLLADPADDIRLLAYGILDGKEKQIAHQILKQQQSLAQSTDHAEHFRLNKGIAELYWELIYQNLVLGDMQSFSAEQVRKHTRAALDVDDTDAGLWFMLARLELMRGSVDAAEYALLKAQEANFARERLLPYIAEMRFLQRRYDLVRQLFAELSDQPGLPALAQSRRYWLASGSGKTGFAAASPAAPLNRNAVPVPQLSAI